MPRRLASTRRSRLIAAPQQDVWAIVADAHHLPRWWPGVARVEAVTEDRFTEVFKTKRGRPVRADFRILVSDPPWRRAFEQEVEGTPFERVLSQSVITIDLAPGDGGTEVTLEHGQRLRGYSRTGAFMLRRATRKRLDEALDGLQAIVVV